MKKLYLFVAFVCLASLSHSQLRMALIGGPHSASVKEQNSLPGWQSEMKPRYTSRSGLNLGILVDIPLSSESNRWYAQTGLIYMAKGRKFYMRNDTITSITTDTISSSHNLAVNYIDIPFNLTYKLPLSRKTKFIISAGPYLGLFYNGKQKFETRIYSSNSFEDNEVKLETGNEEGKMKTINAGWNARAGFEIGNVMLTGFMSEGLTSFYKASYDGTFKHQVRGVSLAIWLNKVKQAPKRLKDADKDGITDNLDACPTLAGTSLTKGCPDNDQDGIANANDSCRDIPGKLQYHGCPVPDTDGDAMNDEEDACPDKAGIAEFNGCPVPDMDADGLNDLQDKCPTEPGTVANGGCPVKDTVIRQEIREKVEFAAKNILFKAGSDVLTSESYPALDEVVTVLAAHQDLKMKIEGHTDSTGKAEKNLHLSQIRAESVKKYLIQKGIDAARLESAGFGSTRPITSNNTPEGRRLNRRVELTLIQ